MNYWQLFISIKLWEEDMKVIDCPYVPYPRARQGAAKKAGRIL